MRPVRNVFQKLSRTEQRREGVVAYLCPLPSMSYPFLFLHPCFPPTVVTIDMRYCTVCKIIRKKIWRNGTALECNAENRRFDPARDYFYFCLRRATHLLSNVALGYALYSTISASFPFTPMMVQVPN
jgi:hypothetical protein